MVKFYDVVPDNLKRWVDEEKCFWVATAPLSGSGHINVSPKGGVGTFKLVDNKTFFYQDLTGSGVETLAHIQENRRITILFNAFEGPPRIVRLFGTGRVHEVGSPEFNKLIPPEERILGSRAVIVVDIHKVASSCGYSVPLYDYVRERTRLHKELAKLEEADQKFANDKELLELPTPLSHLEFLPSKFDPTKDDHTRGGLKHYWSLSNVRSIDGLPGLPFCRKLGGLPPEAVEEDQKIFHEDIAAKGPPTETGLGGKVYQIVDRASDIKFLAGVIVGVVFTLTWTNIHMRA
ncbi:unnamed protein product [Rhizoctonia solani]|uniref:Pyridoxamine 5'-phosphate oxidase N-terminal domain-containing protein n=1 Tax=Rhizoctonia solani TaxID=456999 RepID=A0A8H2XFN5_9AGAM|nr:unnamed protein product [Rhizoctonia solani]